MGMPPLRLQATVGGTRTAYPIPVTPTHGIADPGHTHTVTTAAHGHGITDGGHSHTITTKAIDVMPPYVALFYIKKL